MSIPTPNPTLPFPPMPSLTPRHVAVVGAGAAGLATASQLRREGHAVVVFEKEDKIGGTWIYNPNTDSDPLGLDPTRSIVHSSLYASLRTNLPRELMGFPEYPFVVKEIAYRDPRRFPGHSEVLEYLKDYASEFGLNELVRFGTEVRRVGLEEGGKWRVRWGKRGGEDQLDGEEVFDAVVVCNGHHTESRIADIPGINLWPGKQIHSHNYRVPEPFRDQIVVLIGSAASAVDISRDIATVANEVHVSSRSGNGNWGKLSGNHNIWLHPTIESAHEDGTILFQDGSAVSANTIVHCTGYKYHFPFLETKGIVIVDDNRVGPLYKHIFPPLLAPSLSFVGLPWKVVPFPQCEFQSRWIAGTLSGRFSLPTREEMMKDIEVFYSSLEASGIRKHYTHNMADYQFEYNDWIAAQCGYSPTEEWRKQIYAATSINRKIRPETYRDEWEDEPLILQAHQDFQRPSLERS